MASIAEQLAANLSFKSFSNAQDLKKRLWFTLGVLIVYRFGSYVPLPGIDSQLMADLVKSNGSGLLGMFDMLSGGALGRMSIFALNIMPYITASIIMQLLTSLYKPLEQMKKEGGQGRVKINQYTRYGTVCLASVQAYGIATALELMPGSPVIMPGMLFKLISVVTITGSTIFLMWLGEQITARGIGNGISLIIYAGIVANLPQAILGTLEFGRTGALSAIAIVAVVLIMVAAIAFIVFMERAQRRVLVQYPKRQVGSKIYAGEKSHLPLKINSAGVIPPIFAGSLLGFPATIGAMTQSDGTAWYSSFAAYLMPGSWSFILIYSAMIIFFAFFYTAIVFNPEETAENLKKSNGFILGIRPGAKTAEFFDYVLTRLTVAGSAYLVLVCILPELLKAYFGPLPFYFGGTSILIIVGVTMDTVAQVHSHMIAYQYDGLLKRSNQKGKPRKGKI